MLHEIQNDKELLFRKFGQKTEMFESFCQNFEIFDENLIGN